MPESATEPQHGLHDPETINRESSRWIRAQTGSKANHYGADGDSPDWTQETSTTLTRNVQGISGSLVERYARRDTETATLLVCPGSDGVGLLDN
jgi:hypothetical protein